MKRKRIVVTLALAVAFSGLAMSLHAQSFDTLWKQVEKAQREDLPQTVIKLTDTIFKKGEQEKKPGQMMKAYICRMVYKNRISADEVNVNLQSLEQWIKDEPNSMNRAVLHSIAAYIYAETAQVNRFQLQQRSSLHLEPDEIPDDIRLWSGNLFVQRVMEHINQSLQYKEELLQASSKDYVPYTILGDDSKFYHHDMYHLIASKSIETLRMLSNLGEEELVVNRIADIYKEQIATYSAMKNCEEAVILSSIDYIEWNHQRNVIFRYKNVKNTQDNTSAMKAWDELIEHYGANDVCAEVYRAKAQMQYQENKLVEALETCNKAISLYPKYRRIAALSQIKANILHPQLALNSSNVAYPGDSLNVQVSHKNTDGFTVNIYRTAIKNSINEFPTINSAFLKNKASRVKSEHFNVVRPADYNTEQVSISLLMPNEPGIYVLQVVPDDKKGKADNSYLHISRFKVLSLPLPNKQNEVVVLDAKTGMPVADAVVSFYSYIRNSSKPLDSKTTDTKGKVVYESKDGLQYLTVSKAEDAAMPYQRVYSRNFASWDEGKDRTVNVLKLLTDRSLYRPGQVVYVKGIAYNKKGDNAQVVANANNKLTLYDTNNKELSTQEVTTNQFGSYTAQFVLPSACLNGQFSIKAEGKDVSQWIQIRVEEYKRPTFDIVFDAQKASYKVGDSVQVTGKASSFSGVPLQGLQLNYTVKRSQYSWWRMPMNVSHPIASGSVEVDSDGNFSIPVCLEGESGNNSDIYNNYTYQVEATVTNLAGETQSSSTRLSAGNRSMLLYVDSEERICKDDDINITFFAKNLSGEPVSVSGKYSLVQIVNGDSIPRLSDIFTSNTATSMSKWKELSSGEYELKLTAKDDKGREVDFNKKIILFSYNDNKPVVHTDMWSFVRNSEFDETTPAQFAIGTSHADAYVMLDIFNGKQRIESKALQLSDSIVRFTIPYEESLGGAVEYLFTFVKNGEMHSTSVMLKKRQPAKELSMSWKVFRDKLLPGQKEEWSLYIKNPNGEAVDAEMLALMYDASLDKIYPNNQSFKVDYSRYLPTRRWNSFSLNRIYMYCNFNNYALNKQIPDIVFDRFYAFFDMMSTFAQVENCNYAMSPTAAGSMMLSDDVVYSRSSKKSALRDASAHYADDVAFEEEAAVEVADDSSSEVLPDADVRTNFAETAFFYPQLRTNELGEVYLSFTMPESLTRWNFRAYSHTKDMLVGEMNASVVTAKEFMLSANMPRFARVGDKMSIAATITNLTGNAQKGTTKFVIFDPTTNKVISTQKTTFSVEAGQSIPVSFRFTASDKLNFLGVRMIAESESFSDGEQHLLPVLSNKEFITETIAMPIRGKQLRTFSLDSLFNRNSKTATHRKLTVEFTGNPSWYAVQALPVLSQPRHDNATEWATALYANSLAAYIANSHPSIKAIFDGWRKQTGTKESFLSELHKNQELKNILLEESPWLMEANNEAERQARIATLFDVNNLANGNLTAITKLRELQNEEGAWSWYKGMPGSNSMTGYITELFVRLPLLTKKENTDDVKTMQHKAFDYLHNQTLKEYNDILKAEKKGAKITGISSQAMQYLYLIAISNQSVPKANKSAYDYFMSMVGKDISSKSISNKAHTAVILNKAGRVSEANKYIASIKEYMLSSDERGVYFDLNDRPFIWGTHPISVHVDVMEALNVIGGHAETVEEMKLWLLRQKQTTSWNSSVSTADAIYALLCSGSQMLTSDAEVKINIAGTVMNTTQEPSSSVGLGYIKQSFMEGSKEVKAKSIRVEKLQDGIAWGAAYAQYMSPISDVKQHGGELSVDKKLYVERVLDGGKAELTPINKSTKLKIGDKVVSRITVKLDRSMEFVQLKDQRGVCFEPLNSISGYTYGGGTSYYVEVKDASTNFFFDGLSKGVYVLEYSYRVARSGEYETGIATMQCAYAPEYASHSASIKVEVE